VKPHTWNFIRARRFLYRLGLIRSNPNKSVFIHIQKTAGTSVTVELFKSYPDSTLSHGKFLTKSPEQVEKMRLIAGHFGYGYAREFMDGRFSFTFVREPRSRIISFYKFCRSRPPSEGTIYQIARDHPLDRFLELGLEDTLVRDYLYNHQVWQLAAGWSNPQGQTLQGYNPDTMLRDAMENSRSLSIVGVTEHADCDFRLILKMLGLSSSINLGRENTASETSNRSLSTSTRRRLDRLVELDDKLYNAVLEWRAARI
jgi:hypothetical protein